MSSAVGVCRLCGQLKKLVRSHIIPKSFFEQIKACGKYSVLINANKPIRAAGTFLQAGPYDGSIPCEDCERRFSDFDSYGWQILGTLALNDPVYDDGRPFAYKIACDTVKLRKFVLSVLWRASVSELKCYSRVQLGSRADIVKTRMFDASPLAPNEFPTTAMRLDLAGLDKYQDMLFQPLQSRIYGLISHTLYLRPDLKFIIATGGGDFPSIFRPFLITDPSFFYLLDCPKGLMLEQKFVPAMIEKMRRASIPG
jgi:hypothetical protein